MAPPGDLTRSANEFCRSDDIAYVGWCVHSHAAPDYGRHAHPRHSRTRSEDSNHTCDSHGAPASAEDAGDARGGCGCERNRPPYFVRQHDRGTMSACSELTALRPCAAAKIDRSSRGYSRVAARGIDSFDLLHGASVSGEKIGLDPTVFWKHSLGCAMVCRKLSEKLARADREKAYVAGLLHDIGFLVNSLVIPNEFAAATAKAAREQTPLHLAEL